MRHMLTVGMLLAALIFTAAVAPPSFGDDADQLLTIDHYVSVRSTVPSIAGQPAQIYVRERLRAATVLRGPSVADRVVLFVHGAGTPAEVAFDVVFLRIAHSAKSHHSGLASLKCRLSCQILG